jgi:formate hydrogenlyase transcriptional activator
MGDLGQQGLFDITRILLQQPDLAALSETLTGLVQQSALADRAAIILWHSGNHRAVRHACDDAGQPVSYEDETVLANGPVRRLLSRPDALHCDSATFAETWPQLAGSGLYPPLAITACCRWRRKGVSSAAANLFATTTGRGPKKSTSGCTPLRKSLPW